MWINLSNVSLRVDRVMQMSIAGNSILIDFEDKEGNAQKVGVEYDSREILDKDFKAAQEVLNEENFSRSERKKRESLYLKKVGAITDDTRALNVFKKNGIETIGQLVLYSESDLYKMRGLGDHTIRLLKERLKETGITLSKC